jgi:hypothetical protein
VVENGGKKKDRCVLPNVLVEWLEMAQETLLCNWHISTAAKKKKK